MSSKSTCPLSRRYGSLPCVTVALAAAGLLHCTVHAAIETAGTLFVDIDATQLAEGTLSDLSNTGATGGSFQLVDAGAVAPVIAFAGGTKGIQFDGKSYLKLADGSAVPIPTPDGLTGVDASASIEVWAINPSIASEETLVSWGKRGGPDGSNMSFNYGNNGSYGAVGHWGGPDIGWNNAGGAPEAKHWHHLVYTYDGTTTRVYSDGMLSNTEVLGAGIINIAAATSINLATQLDGDGVTATGGIRGSLTIGKMRIHDGVLTDAQIASNYNAEKSQFIDPLPVVLLPGKLTAAPTHRYSFSESAVEEATGLEFVDSIAAANGIVQGSGAKFSGSRMILPGGGPDVAAYGDLPNGLLSANGAANGGSGAVSIEGWVKVTGPRTWSRLFDFGSSTSGEITGPGGSGNGADYLFYSALVGADVNTHRLEVRNEDPGGGGTVTSDVSSLNHFNTDLHFVVTWDEVAGKVTAYENGKEATSMTVPTQLSEINDVNVWLGRSNWLADQNAQAEFDEFRMYDHVLTASEVLGNFQAGPNTINDGESPVAIVGQPTDLSVYDSFDVNFSVDVAGSPPLSFQWQRNGSAIADATNRLYHFLASSSDSGTTYSCIVSNFAQGSAHKVSSTVAKLTVLPVEAPILRNRYSFNGPTEDTAVTDSVGGANGDLVGGAAQTGGGKVQLDGTSGYVNLPNDLILPYTSITLEAWVQDDGSRPWARIFDFGNSSGGEDTSTGGTTYLFLSQPAGPGNLRGAYTLTGGGGGEQIVEWAATPLPTGALKHVVWVSHAGAHTGRLFVDGKLIAVNTLVSITPADLGSTSNDWLGRSQFNDPYFLGSFDEFRIWEGAMKPAQVAASFAAGPDASIGGVSLGIASQAADKVTLSWPSSATGFVLESATTLSAGAVWTAVTEVPTQDAGLFKLTLARTGAATYYRLRQ